MSETMSAQAIRKGLDHPVIDSDGHWIEYGPHMAKAMHRFGGDAAVAGFLHFGRQIVDTLAMGIEGRRETRQAQESWWSLPTQNTRDRATAMLPGLMRERLDEFGIDFAVVYPTSGLGLPQVPDERQRRAACAAFNGYAAQFFSEHPDRMTPAAVIPMHSPAEAIEELEHVHSLGLKTVMLGSVIKRRIPALEAQAPELADEFPWLDVLGLDSPYDYDPVWQRCLDLGFSPTFHSNGRGRAFGVRNSASSFVYNHIGHFAAASEAVCKALLLGGVTHRFPALNFGFLEGGAGWACQLLSDVLGHWEKRQSGALAHVNPDNLDAPMLLDYAQRYGSAEFFEVMESRSRKGSPLSRSPAPDEGIDEFAACGFEREEDVVSQFVDSFYFGCEADDPMNAWAFKREHLPHGVQLRTLFGSDIGHFDVQDMAGVLPEAYELVEHALIGAEDFRGFVFANAARFLSENNPAFFAGTSVEVAVRGFWESEGGEQIHA
ncbi:MAG: amidohydrolase family protein [Gammaproteobacteria bacterium]|nr:amidohydrolase family protein [Gammaproteobacteria bacterium]